MTISLEELKQIMPHAKAKAAIFVDALNRTMIEFEIDSPLREAAFIAQLAHESGEFRYTQEIASGAAYEGRKDLGNTEPGDGVKFKGRGLIQVTGRANYAACGDALGLDLIASPDLLETPENACRSAGWFWNTKKLNALADKGDMHALTRKINGGLNGISDRLAYYATAKEVLGV